MNINVGEITQLEESWIDPDLLSTFYSGEYYTAINKKEDEIYIDQISDNKEDHDYVMLDRNAQHALYLILKNRFEK